MKDKVFIGWSGDNTIGQKIKNILEDKHDYLCRVGGNSDNSSKSISVGDTVINQIKEANQAIFIFQNKNDGTVSSNLFFELGYALSLYGVEKVHCVKKKGSEILLPSDFDNSFVEQLEYQNDEQFAEEVVQYFFSRQKLNIKDEKYYLINNRYVMKDMIQSYNSTSGSKCSDYELAQYFLFYFEAACMFDDRDSFMQEINNFVNTQSPHFSRELNLSTHIVINQAELNTKILINDEGEPYISDEDYYAYNENIDYFKNQVEKDDVGCFNEWAEFFITQWESYASYLYSNNPDPIIGKEEALTLSVNKANEAYKAIERIAPILAKVNKDDLYGIIALYKSHLYRTLYLSLSELNKKDEASSYLKKCIEVRKQLLMDYRGRMDRQLYNNLSMEYFLAIVDRYKYQDVDDVERKILKKQMLQYLNTLKHNANRNKHIQLIENFVAK